MKNIFSFDAECNGLWGQPFAIAAVVVSPEGKELDRFLARCPIMGEPTQWVKENALPVMKDIADTHTTYAAMLKDFAAFYHKHRETSDTVVFVGSIVESGILWDMRRAELIGDYEAPFPVHDLSGRLEQVGEDPIGLEAYANKFGIPKDDLPGGYHNPLWDASLTARVYLHLLSRVSK